MFRELQLTNFKNFRDATLELGPFTVLVGANASGKSNLRDAFRFLHGVGRGYDLGAILIGKTGEGGETLWNGIRGGMQGASFQGEDSFRLVSKTDQSTYQCFDLSVRIADFGSEESKTIWAELVDEKLESWIEIPNSPAHFRHKTIASQRPQGDGSTPIKGELRASIGDEGVLDEVLSFERTSPILTQIADQQSEGLPETKEEQELDLYARNASLRVQKILHSMRFVDFAPQALRKSSKVGQKTLGDKGQNLASVLMNLCEDEQRKSTLVEWVETLTPMDARDFEFDIAKHSNEVTLVLVEKDGTKTPMQSASDGTLRFLGLLALLFQDDPPQLLFIEEIETGLHPTRLDLLANLIEQRTEQTETQVIATTHSPLLLQVLDQETLEDAQLVYRTGDGPEAKICPLLDVPTARKVLDKPRQNIRDLHSTGWFERVMAFSDEETVE